MRRDTEKLCIAVCGPLPGAVERLKNRLNVECTAFSTGDELFAQIEEAAPFDFMVLHTNAGGGMFPIYYPGCDGDCLVYPMRDPQCDEDMAGLNEMIDILLEKKRKLLGGERYDRNDL